MNLDTFKTKKVYASDLIRIGVHAFSAKKVQNILKALKKKPYSAKIAIGHDFRVQLHIVYPEGIFEINEYIQEYTEVEL